MSPEPSQGTTAPGSVPEELIQAAVRAVADKIHEDLCYCSGWPETCVSGHTPGEWETGHEAVFLSAVLPAHEATVRAKVAEEIEAVRLEWNDEEPEGPNGCCDADVHNCHRDAGERAFAEAIRIARGGQA